MSKNICLTLMLMAALLAASCTKDGGEAKAPEDLKQAVRAVEDMTRPFNLKRSMFSAAYGTDGKPSDFVSFMFSDMGVAEWPPVEGGPEMVDIPEPSGAVGQTLLPPDVAIIPLKPNPEKKKQVVVGFDDTAGAVVITAYTDPAAGPVIEHRIPFTPVPGDPMAKEFFESNRQAGMSYRSF